MRSVALSRRRQRPDDARRRRRRGRLSARAARAASAPALASLRPRSADAVRLDVAGPGARRCSCRRCACCSAKRTCIRSSSRRATSAPRARAVAGWIAGTIVVEIADRRASACSAASPSRASASRNRKRSSCASPSTCCRRCSACCCSPARAAIIVSTANSMLLSPATNLVRDVYQRFLEPGRQRPPDRAVDAHRRSSRSASSGSSPAASSRRCWRWRCGPTRCTAPASRRRCSPRSSGRARRSEAGIYSIAAGMSVTLLWELAAWPRHDRGAGIHLRDPDDLPGAASRRSARWSAVTVGGERERNITCNVLQVLRCNVPNVLRAACYVHVPRATCYVPRATCHVLPCT